MAFSARSVATICASSASLSSSCLRYALLRWRLMAADARLRCMRFCRLASSGSSLGSLRSLSSRSKASSGASEQ
eukprot:CAMPEP_0118814382 /NCGR_PEP_ID=MMETSP1162-20130426/3519_1 /TAXON_ID=33656 /ORGANISM="Phaeocystis Sp, Strain CCMP2710" /LENGTH=73 /DNA_ID=CAMNT_0006744259 /DNA_START=417 /DNA_END=638 /DNA_ORIENTATION=-